MVEIRPPTPEEIPQMAREASRQLGLAIAPADFGMAPEWALCAFEDGRMVTTYGAWPLQVRFNGPPVRMQGVTTVATHPAYRRRGYLRQITREHFSAMRETRETAIAGLHPAWMSIYQRYGYGTVNLRHSYRIDPRDVRFAHDVEVSGTLREIDPEEDFGVLVDIYRRFREERNGLVHRGKAMWEHGALSDPPANHQRTVLVYSEDGEDLGYVIYSSGPGLEPRVDNGPGQYVKVADLFGLAPAAYYAFWATLSNYDNVAEIRWDNAAPDDPLPNMLAEPRLLSIRVRDGIMARLVNLDDAMVQRPYPETASLRFELVDDFCEWNSGRWQLDTDPEASSMSRIDGEDVDITLTPDTLASMAFGRMTASDAVRAGLVEVQDERALMRWDRALRTKYMPYEAEQPSW